jgi:hypothetical protein
MMRNTHQKSCRAAQASEAVGAEIMRNEARCPGLNLRTPTLLKSTNNTLKKKTTTRE